MWDGEKTTHFLPKSPASSSSKIKVTPAASSASSLYNKRIDSLRSVWERSLSQRERVAEGRVRGTVLANIDPLIRPFGPPSPVGRRTRPKINPSFHVH